MKKIYLASPYSHKNAAVRQERYEKACKYAAYLISKGYNVFSPIAHSHGIAIHGDLPLTADYWEAVNHGWIDWADEVVILMLPGWDVSAGIEGETEYAYLTDKPTYSVTPI